MLMCGMGIDEQQGHTVGLGLERHRAGAEVTEIDQLGASPFGEQDRQLIQQPGRGAHIVVLRALCDPGLLDAAQPPTSPGTVFSANRTGAGSRSLRTTSVSVSAGANVTVVRSGSAMGSA